MYFHWFTTEISSKITADGDCNHEIKRCLLLGRKAMTNLDTILKRGDITLPTEVHLVKAMVFTVVMYGCENWGIKKAERQRIVAFELWCWRRLFESPLDCKDVRKHLTGGFLCAVLGLSWILCSLLIPEYSGIKRRGKPLLGLRNARISFISFSIWWKVTIYRPLLIWIAFWPYGLYCSLLPW